MDIMEDMNEMGIKRGRRDRGKEREQREDEERKE